eukprot:44315_1
MAAFHVILMIVVNIISTPIFIYAFIKWYQFRKHFLIKNRFPQEVTILVSVMICSMIIVTIRVILVDHGIDEERGNSIFPSLTMFVAYFVIPFLLYRTHLTYLKLLHNKIIQQNPKQYDKVLKPVHKKLSAKLLLMWTLLSALVCAFINGIKLELQTLIMWLAIVSMINFMIAIVILIMILKNKIRDRLSVLKDTWLTMIILFINFIANVAQMSFAVRSTVGYFSFLIMALLLMYYPLTILRKHEGSLDITIFEQKLYEFQKGKYDDELSSTETHKLTSDNIDVTAPLHVFLKNQTGFDIFGDYLAECFAAENLYFVCNVLVFYHCAKKCYYTEKSRSETDGKYMDRRKLLLYGLKFKYLSDLYLECRNRIQNGNDEDVTFEVVRNCLWKQCHFIYERFIADNAEMQINISFQIKTNLSYLLRNENNKNKFEDVLDFLYV